MGKCECGNELKDGETKCPHCMSKNNSLIKKIFSGVVVVASLGIYLWIQKKTNE